MAFPCSTDWCLGRSERVRKVGVPILAVVIGLRGPTVRPLVGDYHDFVDVGVPVERVVVELTKAPGELHQRGKYEYQVLEPRRVNRANGVIRQRPGEVNARDSRPARKADPLNGHRRHGSLLTLA